MGVSSCTIVNFYQEFPPLFCSVFVLADFPALKLSSVVHPARRHCLGVKSEAVCPQPLVAEGLKRSANISRGCVNPPLCVGLSDATYETLFSGSLYMTDFSPILFRVEKHREGCAQHVVWAGKCCLACDLLLRVLSHGQ